MSSRPGLTVDFDLESTYQGHQFAHPRVPSHIRVTMLASASQQFGVPPTPFKLVLTSLLGQRRARHPRDLRNRNETDRPCCTMSELNSWP